MNTIPTHKLATVLTAASFLVSLAAYGAAPVASDKTPAERSPKASASTPAAPRVPASVAGLPQRDKMKACNQFASGIKGQERKTFMKSCLSKKA